jgi:hypothetical protein
VGTLVVRGDESLAIKIDGDSASRAPLQRRVAPGHHLVEVEDVVNHRIARREVDVAAGSASDVDAAGALPPAVATQVVIPAPRPFRVPAATWALGGAFVAATVVAGVFGVLTLNDQAQFNSLPTQNTADAFNRDRLITNVAWLTGGVTALAGVVILIVGAASPRKRVAVAPFTMTFD